MKEKNIIDQLKLVDFSDWNKSFWILKRKGGGKSTSHEVFRVESEESVLNKFVNYFRLQFLEKDYIIEPYDFHTIDLDGVLLAIHKEESGFRKVSIKVEEEGFSAKTVKESSDLLGANAYFVLIECGDRRIYLWKSLGQDMQPKKVRLKNALCFKNSRLIDLDEDNLFMVYSSYDFIVIDELVFVSNKSKFESSMRFREGIKSEASKLWSDLGATGFIEGVEKIPDLCGDNFFHLRKMASISKFGYYKEAQYFQRIIEINDSEGWGLLVRDGKIIVEKNTFPILLKVLNNDRLRSPINNDLFDAASKSLVKGSMKK